MYFCFEYGEDGFMCPECEREICEAHDDSELASNSFNAPKPTHELSLSLEEHK